MRDPSGADWLSQERSVLRRTVIDTGEPRSKRRGAATLDYALVLGVILPAATIVIPGSIRMIRAVYEMTVTLVAWPFL